MSKQWIPCKTASTTGTHVKTLVGVQGSPSESPVVSPRGDAGTFGSRHAARICLGVLVHWRWRCVLVVWCVLRCDVVLLLWSVATCERVMVTPAVCPRMFEFLATLIVGAQRENHIVSTVFETMAK